MKKTVRILIVLAMGLMAAIACASDTAKREAAEEMLKATQVDIMMGQMFGQVDERFEQYYLQMGLPESNRPIFEKYAKKIHDLIAQETAWDKIKDEIVTAHTEVYTQEELEEITKFYKSPTGKKYLEKMQDMTRIVVSVMQQNMQRLNPQLQELTQQMQEELVKAQAEAAPEEQTEQPAGEAAPAEKPAQ